MAKWPQSDGKVVKQMDIYVEQMLKMRRRRILVEGAWFSPFGFDSTSGEP